MKKSIALLLVAVLLLTSVIGTFAVQAEGATSVKPDELLGTFELNTGAVYASGSHTILTRIGENKTIEQITGYLLGVAGKDYNWFYVYAVEADADGNYVITAEYELLGRPDGVKSDVEVPENGFLVCINATDIEETADTINVGDIVVLENVDLAVLAALQPLENPLAGVAKASFYTAKEVEEEPVEPDDGSLTVHFTQAEGTKTADCSLTLFLAGDEDRYLASGATGIRWASAMAVDADGNVVRVGKNLLSDAEDPNGNFKNHGITIPAGGFGVVFHCGDGATTHGNEDLQAYFNDLLAAAGYTSDDVGNTVLDVSKVGWQAAGLSTEGGEHGYGSVTFYKGAAPAGDYEENIAAKVGASLENPDFAIDLTSSVEDGVMTVVLTLKDLKDGLAMQALRAKLYYDVERLTLTNRINNDNSVDCVTVLPYGENSTWENLTVAKDGGLIDIGLLVADDGSQVLDEDHPLELTFTFEVKEGFEQAGVYVPTNSVVGMNIDEFNRYYGNGAYVVVDTAVEEPEIPDVDYEEDIAAKVGDPLEDADFVVDLTSSVKNGIMTVVMTLKDFKEGVAMQSISANLYYDVDRLILTNELYPDNSLKCDTELPYGENSTWENLTISSEGFVAILFVVGEDETQVLDADHPIVLTFTFEVKEGFEQAGVYVPTDSIVGMNIDAGKVFYGNGAYVVADTAAEEPEEPEVPGELIATYEVNSGAIYATGSHTVLASVAGNTTIEEITGYLLAGAGKDYNYFFVYAVEKGEDGNYVVTAEYETLGRPDGVKSDVKVPENGYLVCISASEIEEMAEQLNVGNVVVFEGFDPAVLSTLEPTQNIEGAKVSFYAVEEEEPEEPGEPEYAGNTVNVALGKEVEVKKAEAIPQYSQADLTDGKIATTMGWGNPADEWFSFYYNENYADQVNVDRVEINGTVMNVGNLVIDLANYYAIGSFRIHYNKDYIPETTNIYVSADGVNYTQVVAKATAASDGEVDGYGCWIEFALDEVAAAQYVKVEFVFSGMFAMLDEVEVYSVSEPCEHENTHTDRKDATCTEDGYEDVVCDDCGETISHEELPALGHDYKDGVCTRCGEKDPDYEEPEVPGELIVTYEVNSGAIYATGSHTVLASVAGNTTIVDITNYLLGGTGGKDYNYFFVYAVEKGEDGSYVVTAEYETLGRPDGVKSDVKVPENGYLVCISASEIEEMAEQLNVGNVVVFEGFDPAVLSTLEPTQNIEGAKVSFYAAEEEPECKHENTTTKTEEPTCTEAGYEDVVCDDCGEVISHEVLPATGHQHTKTDRKDATCTEAGYEDVICEDCGETISHEELPALGHDYKDGVCTRCGEKDPEYVEPTPVGKLGDVDGDGKIGAYDYMMLKRHVLGTYSLSEDALAAADINQDGKVNSTDYMMLRRYILGSYEIKDPNA